MNTENLITDIYQHICLPKPAEILYFRSISEAFKNFDRWSNKIDKVMTCCWDYQFPIAHPDSYWARYHLEKDNYRLDVERSPNLYGCFVYGKHLESNPAKFLTKEQYEEIWVHVNEERFNSLADDVLESIFDRYESQIDIFWDLAIDEDPTNQTRGDEFIFLSSFEWLQKEARFLQICQTKYDISVNKKMLKTLHEIIKSNLFLITFTNMVVVAGLT